MTEAEWFAQACRLLFGSRWYEATAAALDISRTSVVRYAAGARSIPPDVIDVLEGQLKERVRAITTHLAAVQ
jgi:hypothetical protein